MDKREIQNKATELKNILSKYQGELSGLEKEFFQAIFEYQKALSEEKIREIKQSLNT